MVMNVDALVLYESKFLLHVSFKGFFQGGLLYGTLLSFVPKEFVTINDGGVWVYLCCMCV